MPPRPQKAEGTPFFDVTFFGRAAGKAVCGRGVWGRRGAGVHAGTGGDGVVATPPQRAEEVGSWGLFGGTLRGAVVGAGKKDSSAVHILLRENASYEYQFLLTGSHAAQRKQNTNTCTS